jgi:hypothetical protein
MTPGEIHLAKFPYGDTPAMKLRPVLVLTGPIGVGPEVLVAYISSVVPPHLLGSDLLIDPRQPDHRSTNLKSVSIIRLHKLATIHVRSVARRLGNISVTAQALTSAKLRALLQL